MIWSNFCVENTLSKVVFLSTRRHFHAHVYRNWLCIVWESFITMDTVFAITVQMFCTEESIWSLLTFVLPKSHLSWFLKLLQCPLLYPALDVQKVYVKTTKQRLVIINYQFYSIVLFYQKAKKKKKKGKESSNYKWGI